MAEFQEHFLQTEKRLRHLPLCRHHVEQNLVAHHAMVNISGMGTECVWCGHDLEHVPADFLVDMRTL